jgi:hypothetical protein
MTRRTSGLVVAVTGLMATTEASARQHVLNVLVFSEEAPMIPNAAEAGPNSPRPWRGKQ